MKTQVIRRVGVFAGIVGPVQRGLSLCLRGLAANLPDLLRVAMEGRARRLRYGSGAGARQGGPATSCGSRPTRAAAREAGGVADHCPGPLGGT